MKSVTLSCKRFKGKHTAENIRHEYEETLAIYDIKIYSQRTPAGEISPPSKMFKMDFFSFMPSPNSSSSRNRHNSGVSEVDIYLSESCIEMTENPLDFWRMNSARFQLLTNAARKYIATPATSAPVERLFSIAGKIFRPDRCLLTDTTFETLLLIKCNN